MNYRIELYETFDSDGVSIVELFVEIDNQIYRSVHRYIEEKDKKKAVSLCFQEIANMLSQERKVNGLHKS